MSRSLTSLFAAVLWGTSLAAPPPLPAQGTAVPPIRGADCQSALPGLPCTRAVVRMPSHGASATVIYTENGRTLLLGCGHAYQGQDRYKRMTLDVPCSNPTQAKHVGISLLAVDFDADLSLVELRTGPVEHIAPVASATSSVARSLLSVGFDDMELPATVRPAHVLGTAGATTFTRERPWHGRSGGALLDPQTGCLVGVVSGYETTGQRRGMYVSHQAILSFLARRSAGQGRAAPQTYQVPPPWWTLNGGSSTPLLCPPGA